MYSKRAMMNQVSVQKLANTSFSQEQLDQYKGWLGFAKEQRSFQIQEVLRMVVEAEQQRMQNETMAWRVGAGLVGLMFGMADGFQMTDMYQAMAFGTAAGFAHNKFSEKERKFLKDIQFDWVMGDHSPQVIDQRLGRAVSRFVLPIDNGLIVPFSIRKGMRGEHLLPMGLAERTCPGFTETSSREVMERTFNEHGIETLANQFFPAPLDPTKCQSVRKVRWADVEDELGEVNKMAQELDYEPVIIETNNEKIYGYRTEIPYHSDY